MTIGVVFWILMIVWFVFGAYVRWGGGSPPSPPWLPLSDLLIFVLLVLLGIGVFGWPIRA